MSVKLLAHETTNEKPSICRMCGGKCCKGMPGLTLPVDWGAPDRLVMATKLVDALATGRYAIDWWEGDPADGPLEQCYYVRPAVVGHENQLRHASWGGQCTFLGPRGCSMEFHDRPSECRALKPSPGDHHCKFEPEYKGKQWAVEQWIEYQPMLETIIDQMEKRPFRVEK